MFMSHRVRASLRQRLAVISPFGLGHKKPHHFRDMFKVAWDNRDNWRYAWKILSKGVCDGCALGVAGFRDWTISGVHLCMTRLNLLRLNTVGPIGAAVLEDAAAMEKMSNRQLRELGRIPWPMVREKGEGKLKRIGWDEACERIGAKIRSTAPSRLAFYLTSRGITNEVYYVAQKVARFLGTNNVDNAARLCHSPSTGAMRSTLGVAASTCSYGDWFGTDVIVFFGSNPANDQPVAMKYLHHAKKRGTKVVVVNPYAEPGMKRYWVPSEWGSAVTGTPIMDWWFPVSIGGDIAFIYGTLKAMLARGGIDEQFIASATVGWEDVKSQMANIKWEELEAACGISRAGMEEFAEILAGARTGVFVWSMGITQHAFGGDAVQMILNLGLARGFVGRAKCGLMPIRGHSGVQGGAEMGAYATAFPGGKTVNAHSAAELSRQYGFKVPATPGLAAGEMVEAGHRGELDLLYCLGGNFLRTLPQPEYVREAMANVPMRVHQDIVLTDQMFIPAREAVFILPARTRYEQDDGGTETTTERRVIFSPEIGRPEKSLIPEARAEWKILLDIAAAAYPERIDQLGCETGWRIREEIARVVPFYDGIQNLRQGGDQFQYGGPRLCEGGQFATTDGKAHLRAVALPGRETEAGMFRVTTRRGKQFNTLIYAEVDPLTGAARDAVLMSAADAEALHLRQGDRVRLVNETGRFEGRVHLAAMARGNLAVHWPEGNVLLARGVCDAAGVPDYNAWVRVEVIDKA